MKILLHGLNFAPEEIGIGKYSGEMVHDLLRRGCDVTVVTTPPYYPQWEIAEGFRKWGWWRDVSETRLRVREDKLGDRKDRRVIRGQLKVIRCPLWVPGKVSGLKRVIHLASFGLSSIPVVLWQAIRFRPDVILTVEPAAFCMPTTWMAARLSNAKAWLHVQDFEVDAAFELGILKHPLLKKIVLWVEGFMMRRFDRVSTISPPMIARLHIKGVPKERCVLFPNWVDCEEIFPIPDEPPCVSMRLGDGSVTDTDNTGGNRRLTPGGSQAAFGLPTGKRIALYAGNIGAKQGLEIIVDAAKSLRHRTDLLFVICGHGAAYTSLRNSAEGMENIHFLPVQNRWTDLMNL